MAHISAVHETRSDRKLRRRYAATVGAVGHLLNRKPWYERWPPFGVLILTLLRAQLRSANLFSSGPAIVPATLTDPAVWLVRTMSGVDNYGPPAPPGRLMGSVGCTFGRNFNPAGLAAEQLPGNPDPLAISETFLRRTKFEQADKLNLLAAGWIQLQVHDWFDHGVGPCRPAIELKWPKGPGGWMRVRRTPSQNPDATLPTFFSQDTHWWDASEIYGHTEADWQRLAASGWKFDIDDKHGLLNRDPALRRIDDAGVNRNSWLGLELFRALFMMEHNRVMDELRVHEPQLSEPHRAGVARLVIAALMAKIHTLEWTAAMLDEPATRFGTRQVWWGTFGPTGNRLLSWTRIAWLAGVPGSRRRLHGVDYSITEEFVSVYRLHSLLPDEVTISQPFAQKADVPKNLGQLVTPHTAELMDDHLLADLVYSFGISKCGRMTLNNFPNTLRDFRPRDYPTEPIDLAAVDILRDRERGVPRYNEFRRRLHMRAIKDFDELSGDGATVDLLRTLYEGDIERVDLQVGLLTEKVPRKFAFSETAFRVFLLMAERRLEADRFYTTDFNKRTYTKTGLKWIRKRTLKCLLCEHGSLGEVLLDVENPFKPWI